MNLKRFKITKHTSLSQQQIFHISTDIANFDKILPKYFKSLKIIQNDQYQKTVVETIFFLGFSAKIKTRHVIIPPNTHEVYILTGPLRGSSFIESYISSNNGTEIIINVNLKILGFLHFFSFFSNHIIDKMTFVMDEFVLAAEKKIKFID